jgi:hypothetical protein
MSEKSDDDGVKKEHGKNGVNCMRQRGVRSRKEEVEVRVEKGRRTIFQ